MNCVSISSSIDCFRSCQLASISYSFSLPHFLSLSLFLPLPLSLTHSFSSSLVLSLSLSHSLSLSLTLSFSLSLFLFLSPLFFRAHCNLSYRWLTNRVTSLLRKDWRDFWPRLKRVPLSSIRGLDHYYAMLDDIILYWATLCYIDQHYAILINIMPYCTEHTDQVHNETSKTEQIRSEQS